MKNIIEIKNGVARHPLHRMKTPINMSLGEGEHIAIVGSNAGGKTVLVDTIIGKYPLLMNEVIYDFSPSVSKSAFDNIKYIAFRDTYGDADGGYYYQQRWNSTDLDSTPIVKELLPETDNLNLKNKLYDLFHINNLLDKHVILLSSGELRKFQLTKTLLSNPRVLIMDNPFIGLDAQTRDLLRDLLNDLTHLGYLQIIMVLSKLDDIPDFITHVIPVEGMICERKMTREDYIESIKPVPLHVLSEEKWSHIINLPYRNHEYDSENVIELNNVSIRYGQRTILKKLDWTVKRGEMWSLSGENGCGKSTLISLICADNPQSYACDIALFGRKRGSGESIWDIKRHIGYVSPEMHRAYLKNLPTIEIVASGLNDSIGLYRRPQNDQLEQCEWWMDIFGILALKDRSFLELSSGEQRLALLTRAFIKDPELLILDEPLHGLDLTNRRMVKDIIEAFCARENKTMIMVSHYKEELPSVINHSLMLTRNN